MTDDTLRGQGTITSVNGKVKEEGFLGGLLSVGLLMALLMIPAPSVGEEQRTAVVKDRNTIEISCSESQDRWEPIMTLGPIDAADEESSQSEVIKVTLKYLFLQGGQQRRLTLQVKWTLNAKAIFEVNSKLLCDSRGSTGARTTLSGQTQRSDGKAALPLGYIRIMAEELD